MVIHKIAFRKKTKRIEINNNFVRFYQALVKSEEKAFAN